MPPVPVSTIVLHEKDARYHELKLISRQPASGPGNACEPPAPDKAGAQHAAAAAAAEAAEAAETASARR